MADILLLLLLLLILLVLILLLLLVLLLVLILLLLILLVLLLILVLILILLLVLDFLLNKTVVIACKLIGRIHAESLLIAFKGLLELLCFVSDITEVICRIFGNLGILCLYERFHCLNGILLQLLIRLGFRSCKMQTREGLVIKSHLTGRIDIEGAGIQDFSLAVMALTELLVALAYELTLGTHGIVGELKGRSHRRLSPARQILHLRQTTRLPHCG